MLDFRRFDVITFDCYGTLINWEAGILAALRPLREAASVRVSDDDLLEAYAALESALEAGEHMRYREILRAVMRGLGQRFGVPADWPAFPDTIESLRRLKQTHRLAVISNTDDDLFAQTARVLQVPFDWAITAEQVGAYKPSHRNFEHAIATMGIARERILHAAQSRFHDIAPARELGIASVWVNRRHDRTGEGATAPSAATPDLEVPDLKTLADLVQNPS